MAAKRDPNLDREAQEWIEAVIGEKFPSGSYEEALKDGVILCKYVFIALFLSDDIDWILD